MKKKPLKKIKKTGAKKSSPKKKKVLKVVRTAKKSQKKPIGKVTHFFTNIRVAIVKFNTKVRVGSKLHYEGVTTDFVDAAKSMQYDHESIAVAPKGKQIGIKVKKRVREGDKVYLAD